MKLFSHPLELNRAGRETCIAIGTFDGVHLGHQEVIARTVQQARAREAVALAVTFDSHPLATLAPERAPGLIYPLERKLKAIAELGIDAIWLIAFDEAFSRISAESFVRRLVTDFAPLHLICVGSQFAFGHQRAGNVDLLRQLGQQHGFLTCGLPPVLVNGQPVSSTRIREALMAGDLGGASQMLGRPYSLVGAVAPGDGLGRQLGFPTANLAIAGLALPPTGVYAVYADGPMGAHPGVLNIGWRPTVASPTPQLRAEVHLLGVETDLYGQQLELTFVRRLRDETKFASLEALRRQIAQDVALAREYFTWRPAE